MASQTGGLIHWLAAGVTTSAGVAVASGKVRFYDPGTLNPHSVYSDSTVTSAITQPITLSAGGTATVYTKAAIRMIINDALDTTTLYDAELNTFPAEQVMYSSTNFNDGDPFTLGQAFEAWNTSGAGGKSGMWKYKQSSTAVERNLKDWMGEVHVSVKDFGAVGNGAANDTTAIQNTITAVGAAGGGVVYFPPGTYLINAALTIGNSGVSLVGAGQSVTFIKQSGGAANTLNFTSTTGACIFDLSIIHSSSSTGQAIKLLSCFQTTIRNVTVAGHTMAVYASSSNTTSVLSCVMSSVAKVCVLDGTSAYFNVLYTQFTGGTTMVDFGGSGGKGTVAFCDFAGGTTGVSMTFGSQYRVVGNSGMAALTTPFSYASDFGLYQAGNGVDGYTVDVTSGSTVAPDLTRGTDIRLAAASTGVAYTTNVPTPAPGATSRDVTIRLTFANLAGGAITGWGVAAGYHLSAGPSTVNNERTTYILKWDPEASVWRECSRSVTT